MKVKKNALKIVLLIGLITTFVFIHKCIPFLDKNSIMALPEQLHNIEYMAIAFICVTVVCSIFGVPISWFKALAAIYFGVTKGFILSLIAATVSCAIAFLIARVLGKETVEKLYNKVMKKTFLVNMKNILSKTRSSSFTRIFILRNVYFIPFSATNFLMGVTSISFKTYILASVLGMIPGTFTYTYFFAKSISIRTNPVELIPPLLLVLCYYIVVYKLKDRFKFKFNKIENFS